MNDPVRHAVLRDLCAALAEALPYQQTRADSALAGAYIDPETRLAEPNNSGTGPLAAGLLLAWLASADADLPLPAPRDELLRRFGLAVRSLRKAQRPSGRVDLRNCNFDAGPAAAFLVQRYCPLIDLARPACRTDAALAEPLGELETFTRRAAEGLRDGGFHTPNHRWIVVSAIGLAQRTFADYDASDVLDAYRAEGIDIDADGAYIERSAGGYDAVTNLSLLLADAALGWDAAVAAASSNLELCAHLLHGDATVEAGLSTRWDRGLDAVPIMQALCAWLAWRRTGRREQAGLARHLWQHRQRVPLSAACWLAWAAMTGEPWPDDAPAPPDRFERFCPVNRLWRVRDGRVSISGFAGGSGANLLSLRNGRAKLVAVSVRQSYFGAAGDFVPSDVDHEAGRLIVRSAGLHHKRRPAYELPLGERVPPERWEEMLAKRSQRSVPPAAMELELRREADRLACRLRSTDGLDGVPGQIALDFAPGGRFICDGAVLDPKAGQVIVLSGGLARMQYGPDVIEVGPGSDAHTVMHIRDGREAPGLVRVLIPLVSPIDHAFAIRWTGVGDLRCGERGR